MQDLLFFFFKQKTSYEMRISDWSSDVCSSDLHDSTAAGIGGIGVGARAAELLDTQVVLLVWNCRVPCVKNVKEPARRVVGRERHREEIGRATCRERVCKYV